MCVSFTWEFLSTEIASVFFVLKHWWVLAVPHFPVCEDLPLQDMVSPSRDVARFRVERCGTHRGGGAVTPFLTHTWCDRPSVLQVVKQSLQHACCSFPAMLHCDLLHKTGTD